MDLVVLILSLVSGKQVLKTECFWNFVVRRHYVHQAHGLRQDNRVT